MRTKSTTEKKKTNEKTTYNYYTTSYLLIKLHDLDKEEASRNKPRLPVNDRRKIANQYDTLPEVQQAPVKQFSMDFFPLRKVMMWLSASIAFLNGQKHIS